MRRASILSNIRIEKCEENEINLIPRRITFEIISISNMNDDFV